MANVLKKPDKPAILNAPPTVTPQPRMPDPEDPSVIEAKRRKQAEILGRGGRSSTILTGRPGQSYDTFASTEL